MTEVRASYGMPLNDQMETAIKHAAGRSSDFSGAGFGQRDHGWVCKSEIEAHKISNALKKLGLTVEMRP